MPYFLVKHRAGAYINDVYYHEDEIVELPAGEDPMWGQKCDKDGNPIENYNEKLARANGLNEHLAKSIEAGADTKKLEDENAKLRAELEAMKAAQTSEGASGSSETDSDPLEGVSEETVKAVDEAVKLLEDGQADQWTTRGEPKLEIIRDITGIEVTRAQLDAINPRRKAA